MHKSLALAMCFALITAEHASAIDLILPITTDPNPSGFATPPRGQFVPARRGWELLTDAAPLTADPSAFDRIVWEFNAPPGQRYEITPPSPATLRMSFDYDADDPAQAGQDPQPVIDIEFIGLTGTAPTLVLTQTSFRADGDQLSALWLGTATDPFGFTGARLIANGPFDSDQTWDYDDRFFRPEFSVDVVSGGLFPPDQFFNLVPEPTSLALLGLSGLLAARRRRWIGYRI